MSFLDTQKQDKDGRDVHQKLTVFRLILSKHSSSLCVQLRAKLVINENWENLVIFGCKVINTARFKGPNKANAFDIVNVRCPDRIA